MNEPRRAAGEPAREATHLAAGASGADGAGPKLGDGAGTGRREADRPPARPPARPPSRAAARPPAAGRHRPLRAVLRIAAACLPWLLAAVPATAARVSSIVPAGEAGPVRQVVVRFDGVAVAAGNPLAPAPYTLQCDGGAVAGQGRWLDPQRWVFDLQAPLAPGRRCVLRAVPGLSAPDGSALQGPSEHAFSSGAPAVLRVQPWPGERIDEEQHFLLELSGAVDADSVRRSAWCEVEGLGERIGVRLLDAEARAALLRRLRERGDPGRFVLLACERRFAPDAKVRVVWGAGIAADRQPALATRAERRWQWTVRPRLQAEFGCERERAQAPCLPLRPLTLRFNAPVQREQALAVRLVPEGGGAALAPIADGDERSAFASELTFAAPLPENARFVLTLPARLEDEAGRALGNAASFPLAVATGALPPLAKFAAAPFGIVEAGRGADDPALVPLTLRHVQADLAGARTGGRIALRRVGPEVDDAALLGWIARVRRWHESALSAREAGRPAAEWFTTVNETDARGRPRAVKVERTIATRELSLLAADPEARRTSLPEPATPAPRATEVVGVPVATRGYHVLEVESRILGDSLLASRAPMYVRTGALVTDLAVHFKNGRTSSLVWVTRLDRGRPVADARVAVNDCNGQVLWSGRTDASGIARIERGFDDAAERCLTPDGLFVTARHGEGAAADLAFVFSRWSRGIEPWRFGVATSSEKVADRRAHTVFDRTLLRAGETVSMKHFVREETAGGLALSAPDALPDRLRIVHVGSGSEVVQPLAWPRGARSAESRWAIPKTAALGLYDVALLRGNRALASGSFRVEAFRVPLVDARLAAPSGLQVAPAQLAFEAQLAALAGGPMPGAALELSALVRPRAPRFAGFEEFAFEPPRDAPDPARAASDPDEEASDSARVVASRLAARTDARGAARIVVDRLPPVTQPSELLAELGFDDPNGERQTVAQRVALWPSAVVVGIRLPGWAAGRGDARYTVVVLDTEGRPLKDRAVTVTARLHRTLSTRTRLVGGFYAYDNQATQRELGEVCRGRTDARGRLDCESKLADGGEIELVAASADDAGRAARAAASLWVSTGERWWFAQDNDDRIDILPEQRELAPGATARLQVRMPYAQATALVTVEREGVLDARVVTLSGRQPVIELRVPGAGGADSWAPNVHVGVLVLRGRLREAPWWSLFTWGWRDPLDWWQAFRHEGREYRAPTALVDLARPGFKFGVASLTVGLQAQRLDVAVTPAKTTAAVREVVPVTVRVTQDGKPVAGAEVAFAAVDEGLLALAGNDSWRLLEGLWQPRPWGVQTATAVSEVIGRRHYGRKTLPPGGGGGRNPTRELFDTLLLWRGTVALDARGEARIEVPMNDSLTSFRLVAVADDGASRFGSGSAVVRVSQDLQLLPGLAPLVRSGDRIDAGFTLRNTTARSMDVRATLAGRAGGRTLGHAPQTVTLAAGAAAELRWTVDVPADVDRIEWEAAAEEAAAAPGAARDRVRFVQAVQSPVPLRVWQATLQSLAPNAPLALPLADPPGALPGRSEVRATLQPTLATALPALRRWFETYPYGCLEQKTARAIGLRDAAAWAVLADELPGYLDADGLAGFFPPAPGSAPRGSDRLTAHLLAVAHEAGWRWPAAAQEQMLQGLAAFVEGRLERRFNAPRADLDARKLAALEALARHGRAEARQLGSIAFTREAMAAWPTSALLDAWSVLERVAAAPQRAERLAELQRLVRARLVEGGTTLKFATEAEDDWWWLLESGDGNAARLVLRALSPSAPPAWRDDAPRLVTATLARQQRGAWRTTTANTWGVLALEKFSAAFERGAVGGTTVLSLGPPEQRQERRHDWAAAPQGGTLSLPSAAGPFTARHDGSGRPWLTLQTLAAVPLAQPVAAGYRIARTVSAVQRKRPDAWSRGDVLRVRLEIDAAADFGWVVVSDPVPAGATLLGSGLGRDTQIATRGERREGTWPAYEERAADAWRGYYEWLPRGRHVVEYTLRLNSSGRFGLPPTRVEAMYAPENFAELPLAVLEVQP
jgi:uncharacterized protein YfaS (alpha-2-macroglobulin family)